MDLTASRNFIDRLMVGAFIASIVAFLIVMALAQMPLTTFQGPPTGSVPHHVVPKSPPSKRTSGTTPGPTIVQAPGGNLGSPV